MAEVTRSLSSLIKAQYINLNQDKKVIGWGNGFQSLSSSAAQITMNEEAVATSEEEVINMQSRMEEEELLAQKAECLMLEANELAEKIVEDAKLEAESIRMNAMESGKREGYMEGIEQGRQEIATLEAQLQQERGAIQEEYKQMVAQLEPQFAKVLVSMLEKFTGVYAEEHKEIILHLLNQGMAEVEKAKEFFVKVSSEDYPTLMENKEQILRELPDDVELHIREEEEFTKNQCHIEVQGKIIDCSLDVQMKGLITDLKLLACI